MLHEQYTGYHRNAYLGNRLMAGLAGVAVVGGNGVDGDGGGDSHKSGGDNKGLKNIKIKLVNIKFF